MATRKKTNTLTDETLADLRETIRRVLSQGVPTGTAQPFGESIDGDYWLKVTSSSQLSANRWEYTCDLYRSPFATQKVNGSTGVKARNVIEIDATASNAPGTDYGALSPSSTTCGDLKSLKAIGNGTWHRALGRYVLTAESNKRVYAFSKLNMPNIVPPTP